MTRVAEKVLILISAFRLTDTVPQPTPVNEQNIPEPEYEINIRFVETEGEE